MQIHMVIKTIRPYCETISQNVQPFTYKSSADAFASEANAKLTREEQEEYTEYHVESYELEA